MPSATAENVGQSIDSFLCDLHKQNVLACMRTVSYLLLRTHVWGLIFLRCSDIYNMYLCILQKMHGQPQYRKPQVCV